MVTQVMVMVIVAVVTDGLHGDCGHCCGDGGPGDGDRDDGGSGDCGSGGDGSGGGCTMVVPNTGAYVGAVNSNQTVSCYE